MKRFAMLLTVITLAVVLFPSAVPGNPLARAPIRFAYQDRVGSALCIVAVGKGFFRQQGLNVASSRFTSGPACAEALYSGSADIGEMGDTTAVIAVSQSDRFRIIASHGGGENRHRIVVRKDSPIRKPADLVGRKLAVKKGTSTYGGFLVYCVKNGIAIKKVKVLDLAPENMPEALSAGSIDAYVASEPTPSLAEARGARVMGTLGGLGNTYPLLILARKDLLAERPAEVRKFLAALKQAEAFVRKHPREAADLIGRVGGLSVRDAENSMKRHDFRLNLDGNTVGSLEKIAEFLKEQAKIKTVPEFSRVTDTSFLQSVRPRRQNQTLRFPPYQ
jgi:sulfonate transport system substrate-binding protein